MGTPQDLLNMYKDKDELEIRVGRYDENTKHFIPGINPSLFELLIGHYTKNPNFTNRTLVGTVTWYPDGVSKRQYGNDTIVIKKVPKGNIKVYDYMRLSLASEVVLNSSPKEGGREIKRTRTSFFHFDDLFRIDLTKDQNGTCHFEVEFIKKPTKVQLDKILIFVNQQIAYFMVIDRVRNEFRQKKVDKFTAKPISLKRMQIPFLENYVILPKLDGTQYFLFVHEEGLFLFNLVDGMWISNIKLEKYMGMIFTGEYMTDPTPKNKSTYTLIDIETTSIPSYAERYGVMQEFISVANLDMLKITEIFNADNLAENVEIAIDYYRKNAKILDGLLFYPGTNVVGDLKGRVFKWKPPHLLTIDFVPLIGATYKDGSRLISLNVTMKDGSLGLLSAPGDRRLFPYAKNNVSYDNKSIPLGKVSEYRYVNQEVGWEWVRTRPDKIAPNYIDVALSIWDDIMNPIDEEMLIALAKCEISENDYAKNALAICNYVKLTGDVNFIDKVIDIENVSSDIIQDVLRPYLHIVNNKLVKLLCEYYFPPSLVDYERNNRNFVQ